MGTLSCHSASTVADRRMRLLLTSNGLSSRMLEYEFCRMLGGGDLSKKVGWFIPTATLRDGWTELRVRSRIDMLKERYGFGRLEYIDIEYVKGEALLKALEALGDIDFIWAELGNTYNLQYHLRNSGGAEIIKELVQNGTVYVGCSAGAIVAGRSIQTALWKDWDDKTVGGSLNVDWHNSENSRGLDLAGGRSIFPHATGHPYAALEWQQEQARSHDTKDHEVIAIPNAQGVVIDGDQMRFVA